MNTEILRIIEGGLANDKRKVVSYSNRLADRLSREGDNVLASCIRKKIEETGSRNGIIADAVRNAPLDQDSRLQIVEIIPPMDSITNIVLNPLIKSQNE